MNDIQYFRKALPKLGFVLGSGLGGVVAGFAIEAEVPFSEVEGMPASTVPGHLGRFVLVRPNGVPVLIAQGRSHLYEGLSAVAVTAQVRAMHSLGVRTLVLSNAAGAIHADFQPGELMVISDHLNLTGTSPLVGGPHFHDMGAVYSKHLRLRMQAAAAAAGIILREGVYAGLLGPQYETPAEVRMLRTLGADAVGMSTVLEAIQARALGMEVLGISTLTNWAAGLKDESLCHHDVMTVGGQVADTMTMLLRSVFDLNS
jgi:purine-nucleoside phosphorylase